MQIYRLSALEQEGEELCFLLTKDARKSDLFFFGLQDEEDTHVKRFGRPIRGALVPTQVAVFLLSLPTRVPEITLLTVLYSPCCLFILTCQISVNSSYPTAARWASG